MIGHSVLDVAEGELGCGESGGENNSGPDVMRYRRGVPGRGSWCAHFALWCIEESYAAGARDEYWLEPRDEPPFDRFDRWGRRLGGAKLLVRRVGAAGHTLDVRADIPQPGDLICWHRPRNGVITWRGHVGIVSAYDINTDTLHAIEGNRGRYPATVEQYRYRSGTWRRRLYRVVRLPHD